MRTKPKLNGALSRVLISIWMPGIKQGKKVTSLFYLFFSCLQ